MELDYFGEIVGCFGACVAPETEEGFYGARMDAEPLEIEGLETFVRVEGWSTFGGRREGGEVGWCICCCGKRELVVEKGSDCYGCPRNWTSEMNWFRKLF